MAKKFVPFNVNDYVRVKLTDFGRQIHREKFPVIEGLEYKPPTEDENGWSRWQLWCLIDIFGEHVGLNKDEPFEVDIELELP